MASTVLSAVQGARAGLAQLQQAAAAAGESGVLRPDAKLMIEEAAALLDKLEKKVCLLCLRKALVPKGTMGRRHLHVWCACTCISIRRSCHRPTTPQTHAPAHPAPV